MRTLLCSLALLLSVACGNDALDVKTPAPVKLICEPGTWHGNCACSEGDWPIGNDYCSEDGQHVDPCVRPGTLTK